ncbi:MAG: DUF4013 domain-containing protein [Candidatus Woesearchaeota archaeon]
MSSVSFGEGLKYPWKKPSRLWNILWILIPILGLFAIYGYIRKIILELSKGNKNELPEFGDFWENLKIGFMLFVYYIPTIIVLLLISYIPFIGNLLYFLLAFFLLPWLLINLYVKNEFMAIWEIEKAFNAVKNRFLDYLVAMIKTIGFGIIYGLASLVLIGIPCYMFGFTYYLVDFYKGK